MNQDGQGTLRPNAAATACRMPAAGKARRALPNHLHDMVLPIYRHPSLTVLVDDSDTFLRSLSFQLDPSLISKAFHDAHAALDWLLQHGQCARGQNALSASFDTYTRSLDQCNVTLDVDQIRRIRLQAQRFMTPSVLVVDYSMPQMNGIELCEAVQHLPCKKILFTGAADEKIAVRAFNRRLIDRYINKSDADAIEQLEAQIHVLQMEYFAARSDTLRDMLALHHYTFVCDPAFAALVRQLSAQYDIVEHYLVPNPAGVLLVERDGRARLLVVETDQSMDAHYEMALDNHAPASLLAALQARCIIPFFPDGDGMYSSAFGRAWHQYSQAAQVCSGRQDYYWGLFELQPVHGAEPVLSFAQFLGGQRTAQAPPTPRAAIAAQAD
jgi:CheY-like chemotaxis protein